MLTFREISPPFALLALCCLLGGGAAGFSIANLIIYFVASACLALLIYDGKIQSAIKALPRHWALILLLVWLFPLVQLLPLPHGFWTMLPGRETEAATRQALAGSGGWYSLSLAPIETWISFFGVTVFAVLFLSVTNLEMKHVRILLWTICAFAFANILIGAFQLASGGQYLDFYRSGHRANVIGFFANRNHTALFLAGAMTCWTFLIMTSRRINGAVKRSWLIALAGVLFLLFGIVGTTSRAGLAMGLVGSAASVAMMMALTQTMRTMTQAAAFFAVSAALVAPVFLSERFGNVLERYDSVSTDLRWTIWEQAWQVAHVYLPFGSGMGTFRAAYDRWEPIALVSPQYVNNAHNDYIEILIEGGIPALVLLALLIGAIIWRIGTLSPRIWRSKLASIYFPAAVFILFALMHSGVDYPIRRLAIAGPLAVCLAILLREFPSRQKIKLPA